MYALLLLNYIMPFVMITVGVMLKKWPAADMGKQNGYNTPTSRKSQAHWEYAQQIAPDIYIALGKYLFIVEIILNILLFIMGISVEGSLMIGEGLGLVCLFYSFYYTDEKIKEKFSDKRVNLR